MNDPLPAGPYEMLSLGERKVPLYVIPFDKDGVLQAPKTAERLVADAAGADTVIVISHGWNTDFNGALGFYRGTVSQLDATMHAHGVVPGTTIVVGISWPSELLSEAKAPAMAGAPNAGGDEADLGGLTALADEIAPKDRGAFYELAQRESLDEAQALEFARLLAPLFGAPDGDLPAAAATEGDARAGDRDAAGIVATWRAVQSRLQDAAGPVIVEGPSGPAAGGPAAGGPTGGPSAGGPSAGGPAAGGPAAAGFLEKLNPKNIIRLASVLQMKDRAGVVGFRGVGPLLGRVLSAASANETPARVHLVGHSYGCKVVLSALASLPDEPVNQVRSTLLLQPAVSYLALADTIPDLGQPGGYAVDKRRVALPITATWSRHDAPLRTFFALAVRRASDLGDQNIGAAGRDEPPSRFAAMGGYGPYEEGDVADIDVLDPASGTRYPLDSGAEVLAIDGTTRISGHGDVTNPATSWALYNLVTA